MRIAVAFEPATGHLLPVVPLVRLLSARGHDVRAVTDSRGEEVAGSVGLATAEIRDFAPDLVLRDQAERISGAASPSCPVATMSFGILDPGAPQPAGERLHVSFAPPSYSGRLVSAHDVMHARPPTVAIGSRDRRAGRPVVYATLGRAGVGLVSWFEAVLSGLGDLDVDVVCSTGALAPQSLGRPPANVTVLARVEQAELLRSADLMLSHGGVAGIMEGFAAGVPHVLTPLAGDNFVHADRCVAVGAGVRLDLDDVSAASVRQVVVEALGSPAMRDAASRLGAELGSLPGPEVVADRLEAVATSGIA